MFVSLLNLLGLSDVISQKAAIETLDAQPRIQVDAAPTTPLVEVKAPEDAVSTTVSFVHSLLTSYIIWKLIALAYVSELTDVVEYVSISTYCSGDVPIPALHVYVTGPCCRTTVHRSG